MDLAQLGEPDIRIAALRVWVHGREHEDARDHWDGNWIRVTAHCAEEGGSVRVSGPILHLGEVAGFLSTTESLHATLEGEAVLGTMEPNLRVALAVADRRGTIDVEVKITPNHLAQDHVFRFALDQSHLPRIAADLRAVLERYPVRGSPR